MPDLNEDVVVLEIAVARETAQELKSLIARHLWEPQSGLRLILGAGLGALSAESIKELPAVTETSRFVQFSRLLAEAEGRLAGTRYDLAEARESLRRWELTSGATLGLVTSVEEAIRRQNQELAELRSRLLELETPNTPET